ncbi:SDR family NAD(P)-dependent oxidoreductase [Streptomyces sp. NPDC001315]|uniref:SDR family NAD(P)-dependent oxidoreductase n=1 Tax=Streptomyces sp. NPDC001315 TaxID=3364562 RepID=UPI003693BD94
MTGTSGMAATSVLHGRIAVVTGAARGLGAAVARALATRGARVALLGLEEAEPARVAASLPAGSAVYREVDVTDDCGMAAAAEWVGHRLGAPSVVVANAGAAEAGPFVGVGIAYLSWAETGMTEEADAHGALTVR